MSLQPCCLQAVAFYMFTHPAGSSKPLARSVARAAEASEQYGVDAAVDEVAPLSAAEGQQLREGVLHDLLEVSHWSLHQTGLGESCMLPQGRSAPAPWQRSGVKHFCLCCAEGRTLSPMQKLDSWSSMSQT